MSTQRHVEIFFIIGRPAVIQTGQNLWLVVAIAVIANISRSFSVRDDEIIDGRLRQRYSRHRRHRQQRTAANGDNLHWVRCQSQRWSTGRRLVAFIAQCPNVAPPQRNCQTTASHFHPIFPFGWSLPLRPLPALPSAINPEHLSTLFGRKHSDPSEKRVIVALLTTICISGHVSIIAHKKKNLNIKKYLFNFKLIFNSKKNQ